MKRNSNIKIILIAIGAIGLIYYLFTDIGKLHEPINIGDIDVIEIWGKTSRIANSEEKKNIIKWFNSITDIRENKDFAGTTPESGITLKLKSGNSILILKSGSDFEIQRSDVLGINKSYWGKQPNIRDILYGN
jgi:hypothetical protein